MADPPAPAITLVQYPGLTRQTTLSPPCGKVHMALRFKGLDYRVRNCSTPAQVKRFNPRGRVPVLLVGDDRIADSSDILTELDARYPDPPLLPSERRARATARILEDWADEVLYFYGVFIRWLVAENFARIKKEVLSGLPAPARWVVPGIAAREVRRRLRGQGCGLKDPATVRRELDESLDAAADLVDGRAFLTGERITRADLAVAAVLDQFRVARITPELAAEVDRRAPLVAWLARVHEVAPGAAE